MCTRPWLLLVGVVATIGCADGTSLDNGPQAQGGATHQAGAGAGGASGAGAHSGGSAGSGVGGWPGPTGGAAGSAGSAVDGGAFRSCPPGEFVTGVDNAEVQCAPIDLAARAAVNQHCSIYLGWNDYCSGCTTTPEKWGYANDSGCTNGVGGDNTCTAPDLGGETVRLFGLNTDGDVGDDDKFHLGFHCIDPADPPAAGPCAAGSYVSAVTPAGVQCVTAQAALVDSIQQTCKLYFGWNDGCNGCSTAPLKWGQVSQNTCSNAAGANNTCSAPTLGGEVVQLFGLDADGDVDGNDTFYVGLQCSGAQA